jgi:hypothetical protein
VAEFINEKNLERKKAIEASFTLYTSLYHLMLGIRYRLQIDIDIRHLWSALQRLKLYCTSDASQTNMSFITGLLRAYRLEQVGSVTPKSDCDFDKLIDSFNNFIDDETFRQLSLERNLLGIPANVKKSLNTIRRLGRTLLHTKLFRSMFKYSMTGVAVATHIPTPSSDLAEAVLGSGGGYLPPIVPLENHLNRAVERWVELGQEFGAIHFENPIATRKRSLRALKKLFRRDVLHVYFDLFDFLEHYEINPIPDAMDPQLQNLFESHVVGRRDTTCASHGLVISPSALTLRWGETLRFSVRTCCEEAGLIALSRFLSVRD